MWSVVHQAHDISALIAKNTWNLILTLMTTSNCSPRQVYLPIINNPKILCICHFLSLPDCLPTFSTVVDVPHSGILCYGRELALSWLVCTWFCEHLAAVRQCPQIKEYDEAYDRGSEESELFWGLRQRALLNLEFQISRNNLTSPSSPKKIICRKQNCI